MILPIYLGSEIADTVEKVGAGVRDFKAGDAVFGTVKSGGFANAVITTGDRIAHKPASLRFLRPAAYPMVALTAWQAMFDIAPLGGGHELRAPCDVVRQSIDTPNTSSTAANIRAGAIASATNKN